MKVTFCPQIQGPTEHCAVRLEFPLPSKRFRALSDRFCGPRFTRIFIGAFDERLCRTFNFGVLSDRTILYGW